MLCHRIAKVIARLSMEDEESRENVLAIQYGIELTLETIWKIFILWIFSCLLSIEKEFFISVLTFSTLRYFAGGMHMKASISCFLFMAVIGFLPAFIEKLVFIRIEINLLFLTVSYLLIWKYAPYTTPNNIVSEQIAKKNNLYARIIVGMAIIAVCLTLKEKAILVTLPILIECATIIMKEDKVIEKNFKKSD